MLVGMDVIERSSELINRIDTEKTGLIGAEIGVFDGYMSKCLLENVRKLTLIMVDSWEPDGKAYKPNHYQDFIKTLKQEHLNIARQKAIQRTEFANGRRVILPLRSVEAAKQVKDGSLDFVFIDADHSYEGCKEDIYVWFPKLGPGGLICGHDYEDSGVFGVKQAVDEFVKETNSTLELGENLTWFITLTGAENG